MSVNDPLTPRARYTLDLTEHEASELRALVGPGSLRRKPGRRKRETEEFTTSIERMLARLAARAEGDVDQLGDVARVATVAELVLRQHVRTCREIGASWTEIGDRLGTSKQAAQQRFGR